MTIKFEKIEPGMTLWDCRRQSGFYQQKWGIWPVRVIEVDPDKRKVLASWNFNPPEWFSERRITKYRAQPPK
jgi:hypothetical protein